jgi:DIS3-like exonuclease 1
MSPKEYLNTFWPAHLVLHELLNSLKEAILEEDLDNLTQTVGGKKGSAATGYQEVGHYRTISFHRRVVLLVAGG